MGEDSGGGVGCRDGGGGGNVQGEGRGGGEIFAGVALGRVDRVLRKDEEADTVGFID